MTFAVGNTKRHGDAARSDGRIIETGRGKNRLQRPIGVGIARRQPTRSPRG
jgi:hypothetical protein